MAEIKVEDRVVKEDRKVIIRTVGRTSYPGIENKFRTARQHYMEEWVLLDMLLPTILFHRDGCLVEIGVGESTFYMCKHGQTFDRKTYSVDLNSKKLKNYNYSGLYENHFCMWGKSEDFIKVFNEPCAVVLIDGAHDYAIAKMEFDFFFGKLVEGGVIFIHDTYPPVADGDNPAAFLSPYGCGDVWKLKGELEERRDEMEVFTWPYTAKWMGLTMVLKKEKDRPVWG